MVSSQVGVSGRGDTPDRDKTKLPCGLFDAMRRQQNPHIAPAARGTCFLAKNPRKAFFQPRKGQKILIQNNESKLNWKLPKTPKSALRYLGKMLICLM